MKRGMKWRVNRAPRLRTQAGREPRMIVTPGPVPAGGTGGE